MNFQNINSDAVQNMIQDYVSGRLRGSDLVLFEEELKKNDELAIEVEFSQNMVFAVKHQSLLKTKAQLEQIATTNPIEPDYSYLEDFTKPPSSGSAFGGLKGWLLSGIVVLVLVGLYFGVVGLPDKQISVEERTSLLQSYLSPLENVVVLDENYPNPMIEGMAAYDAGNYVVAIRNLSLYKNDDNAQLYLGVSLLLNNESSKAVPILEKLSNNDNPVYAESAQWYLALAYLKLNQVKESEVLLEQLSKEGIYKAKAVQLLGRLDQ